MAQTTARVLALLGLLRSHRQRTGPELARRLGVTPRTLRRDVERLRALGYSVVSTRGADGGYRLEAGTGVPPLLLTDDEAVATAVGLRVAAGHGLADAEATALGALAKLEQVLPAHLRRRVGALAEHVAPPRPGSPEIAPGLLGVLALACRDHERVRFSYVAADGAATRRRVEPHSLVALGRRWLLVGWDDLREDWRVFRLDRMDAVAGTGARAAPRELSEEEAATLVGGRCGTAERRVEAELGAPIELARSRLGWWGADLTALEGGRTRWTIAADRPEAVVSALAWAPPGLVVSLRGDQEVLAAVRAVAGDVAALPTVREPWAQGCAPGRTGEAPRPSGPAGSRSA